MEEEKRMLTKKYLQSLYLLTYESPVVLLEDVAEAWMQTRADALTTLEHLNEQGLIEMTEHSHSMYQVFLTPEGRDQFKVVLTGGAFEILHPGHLATLKAAKDLGDLLFVVVATDHTIRKNKKREPLLTQEDRLEMISSLRVVDAAVIGKEDPKDFFDVVELIDPDIIALGYDQEHLEKVVKEGLAKREMDYIEVKKLDVRVHGYKATKLLEKLKNSNLNSANNPFS